MLDKKPPFRGRRQRRTPAQAMCHLLKKGIDGYFCTAVYEQQWKTVWKAERLGYVEQVPGGDYQITEAGRKYYENKRIRGVCGE